MRFDELTLGLLCVACAAAPPRAEHADVRSAPTAEAAKPEVKAPECGLAPPVREGEPELRLLEAGSEPRRPLRFAGRVGQSVRLELSETAELAIAPAPVQVNFVVHAKATEVREGTTTLSLGISDVEVPEREGVPAGFYQGIREALGDAGDVAGVAQVDPAGPILVQLERGEDTGLGRKLQTNLLRFAVALPKEPIGKGARWEVASETEMGLRLTALTRFELVRLQGSRATVSVESSVRSHGPAQAVCAAPGVVVQPESFTMKGTREVRFDLTRPLALSGKQTVETIIKSRVWKRGRWSGRRERVRVELTAAAP